jgi:hypothetical protein
MRRGASAFLVLTCLGATACSETTAVVEAPGTYSLSRLAGQTLPHTFAQGTCTWQVTDGNLLVSPDSLWQVELNGLWHCPGDTVASYPVGRGYFGTYRRSGRLLLLKIIGDETVYTTGQLTYYQAIINLEPPLDPLTFTRLP